MEEKFSIDAYDSIIEHPNRDYVNNVINRVLREGASLGIFIVMSSNRFSAYRMAMQSNITKTMVLYLVNNDDLLEVMGRDKITPSPIPGRGQVELDDEVNAFQIYQPTEGKDSLAIIRNIKILIEEMNKEWVGKRPTKIPMIPLEFGLDYYAKEPVVQTMLTNDELPLAFNIETTNLLGFKPKKHHFFTLMYSTEDQRRMFDNNVINEFIRTNNRTVLVDIDNGYYEDRYSMFDKVYKDNSEDYERLKKLFAKYLKLAGNKQIGEKTFVYIPNVKEFLEKSNLAINNFVLTLKQAWRAGLYIIILDSINYIEKGFDINVQELRKVISAGIITSRLNDTDMIRVLGSTFEKPLAGNEAYYFESQGTKYAKVRMAGER